MDVVSLIDLIDIVFIWPWAAIDLPLYHIFCLASQLTHSSVCPYLYVIDTYFAWPWLLIYWQVHRLICWIAALVDRDVCGYTNKLATTSLEIALIYLVSIIFYWCIVYFFAFKRSFSKWMMVLGVFFSPTILLLLFVFGLYIFNA